MPAQSNLPSLPRNCYDYGKRNEKCKLVNLGDDLKPFITDGKKLESDKICTTCRTRAESRRDRETAGPSSILRGPPVHRSTPVKAKGFKLRDDHMPEPSPIAKSQKTQFEFQNIGSSGSSSPEEPLDSTFNTTLTEEEEDEETLVMNVPFEVSGSGGSHCISCFRRDRPKKVINKAARLDIFLRSKIWIKDTARTCVDHWNGNVLTDEAVHTIGVRGKEVNLNQEEFREFIDSLVGKTNETLLNRFKDIKKLQVTDAECKSYTGYDKAKFTTIVKELKSMRDSQNRTVSQATAIYLNRLRFGHSLKVVTTVFDGNLEWSTVQNWCTEVEAAFEREVIRKRLGAAVTDRAMLIEQRTSPVAKELLNLGDQKLALIFDGTYMYYQESSYNAFQRQSYSGHKGRPLAKPFIGCTTDGYIIDVWGSFTTASSDGNILPEILKTDQNLHKLLKKGDSVRLCLCSRNVLMLSWRMLRLTMTIKINIVIHSYPL